MCFFGNMVIHWDLNGGVLGIIVIHWDLNGDVFLEIMIYWDLNGYFLGNGDPLGFEW